MARAALAAAQRRGALTRWAVATASARALPLGAFAATLGVVGPDPARLVRQASDALLAGAEKAGVIVGVDDGHLLDDLSATLVHQLALRAPIAAAHAATLAAPLPLTGRERESVTLAAGGLSNRQIADRLVVSVRTVEGHLYRACAKLGASDRAELAALLHGH